MVIPIVAWVGNDFLSRYCPKEFLCRNSLFDGAFMHWVGGILAIEWIWGIVFVILLSTLLVIFKIVFLKPFLEGIRIVSSD